MVSQRIALPVRYPDSFQTFTPTPQNPWPMSYNMPPNPQFSILVSNNGIPMRQALNQTIGPVMVATYPPFVTAYPSYPRREEIDIINNRGQERIAVVNQEPSPWCPDPASIWCTPYPTNTSVPSPYQMWFINAMGRY